MESEIRGRRSYRGIYNEDNRKERYSSLSPSARRLRSFSNTRSEDEESESENELEIKAHHSPIRKSQNYEKTNTEYKETIIERTTKTTYYDSSKSINRTQQQKFKTNNCSKSSTPQIRMLVLIGLILIATIAVVPAYLKDPVENIKIYQNCSFLDLEKKYQNQKEILWKSLRIGIEGVLNNEKPSPAIYLLLHNGKKSSRNLVKKIALKASECFDPESKPIELNTKDFSSDAATDDYGVIVAMYKERIKEGGVALVANLNEIPAETARALHAICDTYEPIAHKAVIFLTLVPKTTEGRPVDIAEKTLTDIWKSKITDYELNPLLARVTDQVFLLNEI